MLRKTNYTRRIAKWSTILGTFDIKYIPRTFVKSQVLADLVAEFAESPLEERVEKQDMVYIDGAANHRRLGVGLVLISFEKIIIEKSFRLDFLTTNKEAAYETLLVRMTWFKK